MKSPIHYYDLSPWQTIKQFISDNPQVILIIFLFPSIILYMVMCTQYVTAKYGQLYRFNGIFDNKGQPIS